MIQRTKSGQVNRQRIGEDIDLHPLIHQIPEAEIAEPKNHIVDQEVKINIQDHVDPEAVHILQNLDHADLIPGKDLDTAGVYQQAGIAGQNLEIGTGRDAPDQNLI